MFTYVIVAFVAFAMALTLHLLTRRETQDVHRRSRVGAILAIGVLSALVFADVAHAQEIDSGGTIAEIRLSVLTVTLIVSVFIPVATAIITKLDTSAQVKGVITLVLNLINSAVVGQVVSDGSAVFSQETLIAALIGMTISVASYLGFYKPVEINAKMLPTKGL